MIPHHTPFIPPVRYCFVLRRVKERTVLKADLLARIEREAQGIPPDVAHQRLKSFFEKNVGETNVNTAEFEANLRAATISGIIAAGAVGASKIAADIGAKYPSAVALKLGLAAMAPWAYFALKTWKEGKNVHDQAYARGYELAKQVKHLPPEVMAKILRDAKAAMRSLDPEIAGFARGVLHALMEVDHDGPGRV